MALCDHSRVCCLSETASRFHSVVVVVCPVICSVVTDEFDVCWVSGHFLSPRSFAYFMPVLMNSLLFAALVSFVLVSCLGWMAAVYARRCAV